MAVSAEEFVRAWQASSNVAEVSKKTGLPNQQCSVRACNMRKKGVKLKLFQAFRGDKMNVEHLNKIIDGADTPPKDEGRKARKPKKAKSEKAPSTKEKPETSNPAE